MKIFVINRRQDAQRREAISAQLEALQLPYEIIEAVDGRALGEAEKRGLADFKKMRRVLRVLSDGEIGCAASHNLVYHKMLDEGSDAVCVLEDDAKIVGLVDWEKLALGLKDVNPRVRLLTDRKYGMIWTVGYIINLAGARTMLSYNEPIWRVADCWESLVRRGLLHLDWCAKATIEPDREFGSVITPEGVPPHLRLLPGDLLHKMMRSFWRVVYGIGLRI